MVLKTREKLIDVARQLFARKGIENTTMNDIATASDKGRRTIYTYFKTKHEIYNAVIERESDAIVHNLKNITSAPNQTSAQALEKFLIVQFGQLHNEQQERQDISIWSFSRDSKRAEKLRTLVWHKEIAILQSILKVGVESGEFDPDQALILPDIIFMLLRSFNAGLRRVIGSATPTTEQIAKYIVGSVQKRFPTNNEIDIITPNT
ncbi:MAG: TetR/AcrR family transcriptional regulator [Muribaculaceae bacterium]|nr:TetR/AcrR family transcriptional regulator [Muribaculaceae bacterium]